MLNKKQKYRLYFQAIFSLLILFILTGCSSENDSDKTSSNLPTVKIEAEIFSSANSPSRYIGSDIKGLSFSGGDEIGIFINSGTSNKWTLTGNAWEPMSVALWPDTTTAHNFHAFYPYNEKCSFDSIFTESLSGQDGSLENLNNYDLLIAKKSASYNDANGLVSFSGEENSFRHALSLLRLSIKPSGDLAQATINSLNISCPHLFSRRIYSFRDEKFIIDATNSIDNITLYPEHKMNGMEKEFYIIVGPKDTNAEIIFTINYLTEDGNNNKSARLSNSSLATGLVYQYNIWVIDGNINIDNPIITDWEDGNETEDIYI